MAGQTVEAVQPRRAIGGDTD